MDAAELQFGLKETSERAYVPQNDVARLMYYLRCVLKGCGIDIIPDHLLDYGNYKRLSSEDADKVFMLAYTFSPDELIGKVLFEDNMNLCESVRNKFFEVTAVASILSVRSHAIIAGQAHSVSKIMVYKREWMKEIFEDPMQRNAGRLMRIAAQLTTKHCRHCKGESGPCACSDCPRETHSQCVPESITSLLAKLLIRDSNDDTDHCDHCRGKDGKCACAQGCPRGQSKCIVNHQTVTCGSCKSCPIIGARYHCLECLDYNLCASCYHANHHDLTHRFERIEYPGVSAVRLAPRKQPRPKAAPTPKPAAPRYRSMEGIRGMSIASMKTFLRENQVSFDGIFEKERLCRLVWETQIDCMSAAELSAFMQRNGISLVDCTNIASRRAKAKDAFQPMRRPLCAPRTFKCGQRVKLVGLKRVDMNGKRASVVSDSCGAERVDVQIDGSSKTFAVKAENLLIEIDVLD